MRPAFGGIDVGTSNSTVGVMENGRPRLVALEGEQVTLPSAIFFNFEDDATYVGRRAMADYKMCIRDRPSASTPELSPNRRGGHSQRCPKRPSASPDRLCASGPIRR